MCLFKPKNDIRKEILNEILKYDRTLLDGFLKRFCKNKEDEICEKAYSDYKDIMSVALSIPMQLNRRKMTKEAEKISNNIELLALNIIHNCAIYSITSKEMKDFILDSDDVAFALCGHINDLKLFKELISYEQYEENKLLANKLSIRSPLKFYEKIEYGNKWM